MTNRPSTRPVGLTALHDSLRIAATYVVLASAWILFSDRLLAELLPNPAIVQRCQTFKGLAFVGFTGLMLAALSYRRFSALLRTQQQAREHHRMFTTLVGNLSGMAYRCAPDARWTMSFVSEGCRELTGYAPEDLLDNQALAYGDLIHPEDADMVRQKVEQAIARQDRFALAYRICAADGTQRWVWEQGRPIFNEQGELLALEGFVTDITAQKRTEQALRESEAHYRRIIETSEEGIWIIDAQSRTTYANQKMARMLGCSVEEMLGKPMFTFFDEEGRRMASGNVQRRRDGIREAHDFKLIRRDGTEVWTLMSCNPIFGDDGTYAGALAMVTDVTDRRRAERLEAERRSLLDAHRAMEQALGVVGHELRTPLASLRAMAEYLLTDGAADPQQEEQFLRNIHGEVVRMSEMVNNMLEAARLGSGSATWQWERVALGQVCADALEIVRPMVDPDNVHLAVEVAPDDLTMRGDIDAVQRLILNLLSNALRHTRRGAIHVRAGRERKVTGNWIRLEVEDTGQGLPREMLNKLGVAFALNRGAVDARAMTGTGLGLAICNQIAAAHGGHITVRSRPGQGATFTAWLRADLHQAQDCEGLQAITPEMAA